MLLGFELWGDNIIVLFNIFPLTTFLLNSELWVRNCSSLKLTILAFYTYWYNYSQTNFIHMYNKIYKVLEKKLYQTQIVILMGNTKNLHIFNLMLQSLSPAIWKCQLFTFALFPSLEFFIKTGYLPNGAKLGKNFLKTKLSRLLSR